MIQSCLSPLSQSCFHPVHVGSECSASWPPYRSGTHKARSHGDSSIPFVRTVDLIQFGKRVPFCTCYCHHFGTSTFRALVVPVSWTKHDSHPFSRGSLTCSLEPRTISNAIEAPLIAFSLVRGIHGISVLVVPNSPLLVFRWNELLCRTRQESKGTRSSYNFRKKDAQRLLSSAGQGECSYGAGFLWYVKTFRFSLTLPFLWCCQPCTIIMAALHFSAPVYTAHRVSGRSNMSSAQPSAHEASRIERCPPNDP